MVMNPFIEHYADQIAKENGLEVEYILKKNCRCQIKL